MGGGCLAGSGYIALGSLRWWSAAFAVIVVVAFVTFTAVLIFVLVFVAELVTRDADAVVLWVV